MGISSYQRMLSVAALVLISIANAPNSAATAIGTNTPAQSLTPERVRQLPAGEQAQWLKYLERSAQARKADKDTFATEMQHSNVKTATEPPHGSGARSIPLDREASWYAGSEAEHIADVIVSYQTPAGGWCKNLDMSKEVRRPGEMYGPDNVSNYLAPGDFDTPSDRQWEYIGTIDNDATTSQLKFLAKVISARGESRTASFRKSFEKGMNYLLSAQYPNGGWPQVWPLEGGYHDAITYNDNAMTQVLDLLNRIANPDREFSFVSSELRSRAAKSFEGGIRCILATQIRTGGSLTAWAQQVDPLTLQPTSARNFEMPAISAGESAAILLLMMNDLPNPTSEEIHSIYAGIAWLRAAAISGKAWESTDSGRDLVPKSGAGPLWARYYQVGTNKPIFGDRDKSIHDDVREISTERRNGYAWYSDAEQQALNRFETWSKQHPESK